MAPRGPTATPGGGGGLLLGEPAVGGVCSPPLGSTATSVGQLNSRPATLDGALSLERTVLVPFPGLTRKMVSRSPLGPFGGPEQSLTTMLPVASTAMPFGLPNDGPTWRPFSDTTDRAPVPGSMRTTPGRGGPPA